MPNRLDLADARPTSFDAELIQGELAIVIVLGLYREPGVRRKVMIANRREKTENRIRGLRAIDR